MADYQQLNPESGNNDNDPEVEQRKPSKMLWGYPMQVYFILGNEFCERFSYYGMHAILVIYLTSSLHMSKDDATAVYHAFNMLCYFSPIFGAIIADSYWGKYKTILYVSLIYALGNIVVSITAVPSVLQAVQQAGPYIGLILIALGTGGIKPCVSAFGGDQFEADQASKLASFFSFFYFSINLGSAFSMILTPALRGDVQCFGRDCYPLAFGVPAILMVVSLILFVSGSALYKKVPPEGNVVIEVASACGNAIKNRLSSCGSGEKREHWIEWADTNTFSPILKSDIKALFKVLFMFLPLPIFWTLFDQQGSRWVLQAMEMNGDIGFTTVKPDQMQALNPVFVMVLIPFVEFVVYPILRKCHLLKTPLQKMGCGMILTSLSFVVAGFLQLHMEAKSSVANLPATGFSNFRVINTVPCGINVYGENMKVKNLSIPYHEATDYFAVPVKFNSLQVSTTCSPKMELSKVPISIQQQKSYSLVIGTNHSKLITEQLTDDVTPLKHGSAKVRFVHAGGSVADQISVKLGKTKISLKPFETVEYRKLDSRDYNIHIKENDTHDALGSKKIHLGNGGIYTVVIQPNKNIDKLKIYLYADVSPRPISILWQVPQYLVITLGEVMFSITGLEFAYSQSPPSMKSCIMAAWLLTVSIGNLLVVILAGVKLTEDMAEEFFFFAILCAVVTVIFAIMSWFYKYVYYGSERTVASLENDERSPLIGGEEDSGVDNDAHEIDKGGKDDETKM